MLRRLLMAVCLLVVAGGLWGAEPWRRRLEEVRSTPGAQDEVALAAELLERARQPGVAVERVDRLCSAVVELAERGNPGLAVSALEFRAWRCPAGRTEDLRQALARWEGVMAKSEGLARRQIGGAMVGLLVWLGRVEAVAGEVGSSAQRLQRAAGLAEAYAPQELPAVEQCRAGLDELGQLGRRAEDLRRHLRSQPADVGRRIELLKLLVFGLDDPPGAEAWLSPDLPVLWRSYVPLAVRGPAGVPAAVAANLAAWYAAHSGESPQALLPSLRVRQRVWWAEVLRSAPAGVLRKQAEARWRELAVDEAHEEAGLWALRWSGPGRLGPAGTGRAVVKAREFLWSTREPNGLWLPGRTEPRGRLDPAAASALVCLSLLRSGVRAEDPRMLASLEALMRLGADTTAGVALRCAALAEASKDQPGRFAAMLQRDVRALLESSAAGEFGPGLDPQDPARRGELLWTYLATLGLARALQAGVAVPERFFTRQMIAYPRFRPPGTVDAADPAAVDAHFTRTARTWGLLVCNAAMGRDRAMALRNTTVRRDLAWLAEHQADGANVDPVAYLLATVRLATSLGAEASGGLKGYAWACRSLLARQRPDGAWRTPGRGETVTTAMGLGVLTAGEAGW